MCIAEGGGRDNVAPMTLHLIKLCVGAESVDDLRRWIAQRLEEKRKAGLPAEQFHTTRMAPKRRDELLDGGSLYWVVKGLVQCRQRILDLRPFTDDAGIGRCRIVLEQEVIDTRTQPRRPFQGWRYLKPADAPADLSRAQAGDLDGMPPEMRRDLAELGLI